MTLKPWLWALAVLPASAASMWVAGLASSRFSRDGLIRAFCANPAHFQSADGYAFGADKVIELDRLNPQVGARVARAFDRWKKFDETRQGHARAALERIRDASGLSRDVGEIVQRGLA